ncbi:MAG: hypothetical protein NXH95_13605 [Pseudomonadaceae bacterium]|nr:hypothetical protein [Pseudomonadaceae bacterium]
MESESFKLQHDQLEDTARMLDFMEILKSTAPDTPFLDDAARCADRIHERQAKIVSLSI